MAFVALSFMLSQPGLCLPTQTSNMELNPKPPGNSVVAGGKPLGPAVQVESVSLQLDSSGMLGNIWLARCLQGTKMRTRQDHRLQRACSRGLSRVPAWALSFPGLCS